MNLTWSPSSSSVSTAATGAPGSAGTGFPALFPPPSRGKAVRESRNISAIPADQSPPCKLRWINLDFSAVSTLLWPLRRHHHPSSCAEFQSLHPPCPLFFTARTARWIHYGSDRKPWWLSADADARVWRVTYPPPFPPSLPPSLGAGWSGDGGGGGGGGCVAGRGEGGSRVAAAHMMRTAVARRQPAIDSSQNKCHVLPNDCSATLNVQINSVLIRWLRRRSHPSWW